MSKTETTAWTIKTLAENGFVYTSRVEAHTQASAEAFALRDVLVKQHAEPAEVLSVVRHPWVARW